MSGRTAAGVWGGAVSLMTNDYAHGYMDPDQDHTAARADLVRA